MAEDSPYAGRWVALIGEQVVGVGRTADEALQAARHSQPKEQFIIRYEEARGDQPLAFAVHVQKIRAVLANQQQPIYLVGGAVRDALLDRSNYDLDFVVPRDAIKLAFGVANALNAPVYVLDQARDTGRVVLTDRKTMLDFARFRGSTLEEDLRERDFTINAMALPATARFVHSIIDPTGGLADLKERKIRLTHSQAIQDDPVRTLRALRLAAGLDFELTKETQAAIIAGVPGLEKVSEERKRDELIKILMTNQPGNALGKMEDLTLLQAVLPEIAALAGVQQSPPHFEDVLAHTRRVLNWLDKIEGQFFFERKGPDEGLVDAQAALDQYIPQLKEYLERAVDGGMNGWMILRLGALFHDVGKKETQKFDEDGRIRFFGHAAEGAKLAGRRMRRLCLSKKAITQVKKIVAGHMRPLLLVQDQGGQPSRRAVYRYFQAAGKNGLDIGLLALADHLATYDGRGAGQTWPKLLNLVTNLFQYYFEKPQEAVKPPPLVNGRDLIDLLDMEPGPEIGRMLRLIAENQAAGEINSREEALQFVQQQIL